MAIGGNKIQIRRLVPGFLAGILGGILTIVVTNIITVDNPRIAESTVEVDKNDVRQGEGSLRWDFELQPERRFLFSPTVTIGGYLHFEVRDGLTGRLKGLDLSGFSGVRFYAKSSFYRFRITEANLFTGGKYLQYMLLKTKGLVIDNKWNEYFLSFSDFSLAPWEREYRLNLLSDLTQKDIPNLRDVTAFGLDLKTSKKTLAGKLWIDYIQLVDANGNEILFSNADSKEFTFDGRRLIWISNWNEYP